MLTAPSPAAHHKLTRMHPDLLLLLLLLLRCYRLRLWLQVWLHRQQQYRRLSLLLDPCQPAALDLSGVAPAAT
jgi:hypothetical protein